MLQTFVRDTKVSFIAFQFFVGKREALSYGLNFGTILNIVSRYPAAGKCC